MALTQWIKDTFLGLVPSLSLVLAIILLQFFSETVFRIIESLVKPAIRRFMQRRTRFILDLMPNFDSFIIFLLSLLFIAPFLTVLMRDVFTPFLRSLANNLLILIVSLIMILFLVYFGFEKWYIRKFRHF